MKSHSRGNCYHRDYGQTTGEHAPTPADSPGSKLRFLAGRRLRPDNQRHIGAARKLDADGIVHALGGVILLQPRTQATCLDPYHGIDLRIVVRTAIEYVKSDRIFLEIVGVTGEESVNRERKKTLEALGLGKSRGLQDAGHVVSDDGVRHV